MSQPSLADCARENARALVSMFTNAIGLVAIMYLIAADVMFVSRLFAPLTLFHALASSKGAIGLHFAIIIGVLALTPFGLLFGMSSRLVKSSPRPSAVVRRVCQILLRRVREDTAPPSGLDRQSAFEDLPWLVPIHARRRALVQVPCAPPPPSGPMSRARRRVLFPFASGGLIA